MVLSEESKIAAIEVILTVSAINIKIENNIYRDGELISSINEREGFSKNQRASFLLKYPELLVYSDLAGLTDGDIGSEMS